MQPPYQLTHTSKKPLPLSKYQFLQWEFVSKENRSIFTEEMKLTAQILLKPNKEQKELLYSTMIICNKACDNISQYVFRSGVLNKYELQKQLYFQIKAQYKLTAQAVLLCLRKVHDSYKTDKDTCRAFKKYGAVAYDSRIIRYIPKNKTVSIWTIGGRIKIPYVMGERQYKLMQHQVGESDLVYKKGKFYLMATCDVKESDAISPIDVLGVDFGIVSLATNSDGDKYCGAHIEKVRQKYQSKRSGLQSIGTKSAKRKMRKIGGKEKRFRTDVNHRISKETVAIAKGTNRAIALEDLSGIRQGATVRHSQRAKHSSWAFYQLRSFITYKAKLNGVQVIIVNPKNTSRTCNKCGHCEKANRKSQGEFVCKGCGHSDNADFNAAKNIKLLGLRSIQPMVSVI